MSIHLMCLSSSGTPIFTKKRGDNADSLPYSTIASLNGVHLFCKTQNVGLSMTTFDDNGLVYWKVFDSNLLFIGISTNLTEKALKHLVEMAFQAMIFNVGIIEVQSMRNVERFKRDLKSSYFQLVEKLMDITENDFCENESILCSEAGAIHEKLIEFSQQIFSPYTCILSRNRLICATEGFYDLDVSDRKLLILLLSSSSALQKDFPIFLPKKSPTVAYRLVSLPLIQGISICMICGVKPTYDELETLSQEFWQDHYDLLVSAEVNNPRNFPASIELDPSIMGFLLINKTIKKYVISRNVQQVVGDSRRGKSHLRILRAFFHQSVDSEDFSSDKIKVTEEYYTSDYHKCHAIIRDDCTLCVLYLSAVPTHAMRFISQDLLLKLLGETSYSL